MPSRVGRKYVTEFMKRSTKRPLHTFLSLRPARHYPRFWIQRSSSERRRDFNPPDLGAAQRTLRPLLTSTPLTSAPRSGGLAAPSVHPVSRGTRRRSPRVSPAVFLAHPPDLQSRPLMDMDFATSCPLVRPVLPRIRLLFVRSRFRSTLPSD